MKMRRKKMKFVLQSDEHVTRADLENGGKVYFNIRDYRRYAHRETPLVCVFYEGPAPEREMDYFEMSIFMLDGMPMIGGVPIGGERYPEVQFLNISSTINAEIASAVQAAFREFVERQYAKLEDLASSAQREIA